MFRGSFVRIFEPKLEKNAKGEEINKYSIEGIFEADADFTQLKEDVKAAIQKKWKGQPPVKTVNVDGVDRIVSAVEMPWRKGTKENFPDVNPGDNRYENRPEIHGKTVMNLKSSKIRPGCAKYISKGKVVLIEEAEKAEIYAGAYYIASYSVYAWSYMGKNGVSVGINNLIKMKDGEPLSSMVQADREFDSIDGDVYGVADVDNSAEFQSALDDLGI